MALGILPKKKSSSRLRRFAKLGNETICLVATRPISDKSFSGYITICKVTLQTAISKAPSAHGNPSSIFPCRTFSPFDLHTSTPEGLISMPSTCAFFLSTNNFKSEPSPQPRSKTLDPSGIQSRIFVNYSRCANRSAVYSCSRLSPMRLSPEAIYGSANMLDVLGRMKDRDR